VFFLELLRREENLDILKKKIYYNSMKSTRKTSSKASVSQKKTVSSKASVSPKKTKNVLKTLGITAGALTALTAAGFGAYKVNQRNKKLMKEMNIQYIPKL
jgi:hypothetical protein